MVLTIWDLFKALYKHKIAIIAVTLAAFLCTYIYINRNQSYTAKTVVEYKDDCIKEGKALDGTDFDVYEMISPSVISDVIEDLSLSHSVESIRSQITIDSIIPDSQTALREANEKEGEEYNYYPTSFVISFKASKAFTYAEARDILDSLIQNYLTYYTEKYMNLATLQEIDYGMENADFDYIEKAEILRSNINSTINTLASYSNADSKFRSTSTGYTFNDISKEFTHLSDFNIPLIFSEIYKGQVTTNKALLLDKYREKKEQYELTAKNMSDKANLAEDRMNTFADANVSVPNSYNTDDSGTSNNSIHIIDGVYDEDGNAVKYNEQTTYDDLIGNYVDYSINANNNTIDAQYCQNIIDIFSADADSSIDRDAYAKSVDANIKETSAKLKELYQNTYNAIDDYNQYIAAKHMSFLTGVQYYENINTVVFSLLALILGFGFMVIFSIAIEIFRKYRRYTLKRMKEEGDDIEEEEEEKKKGFFSFLIPERDTGEIDKDDGEMEAADSDNSSDTSDNDSLTAAAAASADNSVSADASHVELSSSDDSTYVSQEDNVKNDASENEEKRTAKKTSKKKGLLKALKIFSVAIGTIIILAGVVLGYIQFDNSRVKNTEYTYTSEKVTAAFDGFKIGLVTDYHNSDMKDKVVAAVKSGNPDIICIGGDLVDLDTEDFDDTVDFVKQLTEIAPVYYAYGNHEIWSNNINNTEEPVIAEKLKDLGVNFLNDKTVKIEKDGEWFYLTGFEDLKYDDLQSGDVYTSELEKNMAKLSKNITEEDKLSLLIFHRANYFETVSKYPYDLVLAGHIHAGQIGISALAQKVVDMHLGGSKYIVGEYAENGNKMIVCGGIGCTFDLPRIFCTPEVVTITLSSDSEETAAPESKETTAPDNKETTAPDHKETAAPDSKETTAPDDKETAAPDTK